MTMLSELEPGTVFRLTEKGLETEKARLKLAGLPVSRMLREGPYQVYQPKQESYAVQVMARIGTFIPHPDHDYEVEVVSSGINKEYNLPSRDWIYTSADPEVFLVRDGKLVPGFEVLPDKKKPHSVDGGVFHEDGFAAEFSPVPVQCHESVVYHSSQVISEMIDRTGTTISDENFIELSPDILENTSESRIALGCDRSENVWGHPRFNPGNPRKFPYRMAGGHIHLGMESSAKWFHSRAERIIKAMDVFCGVPSVALLAGLEDPRRRQFYGRAGEFRFQKHGLEYRVLSNAWLQHQALTHLTLNMARGAFRIGCMDWEKSFKFDPELVRHIINEHDVDLAKKFVEENAATLVWMLDEDGGYGWGRRALTVIHDGAKKTFANELGIHKSWYDKGQVTFNYWSSNRSVASFALPQKKEEERRVTAAIEAPVPSANRLRARRVEPRGGRTATGGVSWPAPSVESGVAVNVVPNAVPPASPSAPSISLNQVLDLTNQRMVLDFTNQWMDQVGVRTASGNERR
jgi:Phage phiEco32-like COOH.NH2 ligase-type 2